MILPTTIYSALLIVAGIACLIVATMVGQHGRTAPGAVPLIVLMLALSWWDLTYALFWAGLPGPTPYFWLDLTYFGLLIAPTALLVFALQFARLTSWLTRPMLLALTLEPLLVLILMWTDPWHGLFFGGRRDPNAGMILDGGPVFWANVIYSYLLILIACMVLIRVHLRAAGLYRRQTALILGAIGITWLNSIIFLLGLSPLSEADNTPFAFSLTALVFAFALLRYRLLDVVPIAHDVLLHGMSDGVVVLDAQNRIVDLNPAAQALIGAQAPAPIGAPAGEVFGAWPDVVARFAEVRQEHTEITLGTPPQILDLHISPLLDRRRRFVGRLIVWRDITSLKSTQDELYRLATTDVLTQLINRRYFLELAEHELRRAVSRGQAMAIALIDIDHFKRINDTYGHAVGDQALIRFAALCRANLRDIDIFARYGGEEFVLLLPETTEQQALTRPSTRPNYGSPISSTASTSLQFAPLR
jgi:PAS domain-containing protein